MAYLEWEISSAKSSYSNSAFIYNAFTKLTTFECWLHDHKYRFILYNMIIDSFITSQNMKCVRKEWVKYCYIWKSKIMWWMVLDRYRAVESNPMHPNQLLNLKFLVRKSSVLCLYCEHALVSIINVNCMISSFKLRFFTCMSSTHPKTT